MKQRDIYLYIFLILSLLGACQSPVVPEEEKPVTFRKVPITGIEYQGGGYVDGTLQAARFSSIADMAFDEKGNFYVADAGNNVIRYVDLENDQVSTFAGEKYAVTEEMPASETYRNGSLKEARFSAPVSLAMTSDGALYVADSRNHKVRKIYKGQVTTLLGDSPENISPGENPKKPPGYEEPERQSGSLDKSTTFFPSLLRSYQTRYLFLYETYLTSRFIDLERSVILGAEETFGEGYDEDETRSQNLRYWDFGDVRGLVFDRNGDVWISSISPGYLLTHYSVSGQKKQLLGHNQTNLCDGFVGNCWSDVQQDGDFERFSFRSPTTVLMGSSPNYLFVRDSGSPSTLRLVNLEKKYVSTVAGVEDFDKVFISPKDQMYTVRGRAIYRIEPSPVKVLTSGETR